MLQLGSPSGSAVFPIRQEDFPAYPAALNGLTERTAKQIYGKAIPPDEHEKLLENAPLKGYAEFIAAASKISESDQRIWMKESVAEVLRQRFPSIAQIPGISVKIDDFDPEKEVTIVNSSLATYKRANMAAVGASFSELYSGFASARELFADMDRRNELLLDRVIPVRYLPELLVAAPVWYVHSKDQPVRRPSVWKNPKVTHFCDLMPTQNFANLFQLYNRQPMSFEEFDGSRDLMPPAVADLIADMKSRFDFMVIATPYHDLATKEWRNPSWQRNIDPFLFGFLKSMPDVMFFLARWSGAPFFPMITDMMADTISHIRSSHHLIQRWDTGWREVPWYVHNSPMKAVSGRALIKHTEDLLQNYQRGELFDWLRTA